MRSVQKTVLKTKTSLSQPSLQETRLMTPEKSRKEEKALIKLERKLKEYESMIAMQQQEIVALKKANESHLLLKSTPEKSEYFPKTPPHFVPISSSSPIIKTELKSKEVKSKHSLLNYSEFKVKETLETLSQDVLLEDMFSLFDKTKISEPSYEKDILLITAPLANQYRKEDQIEIKSEIDQLYESADISYELANSRTPSSRYITKNLEAADIFKFNKNLWPVVPMAHKWVYDDDGCDVRKYRGAEKIPIDVIVYGNLDEKINYLTLFNGVTVQSYANTRYPTYQPKNKNNISYADSRYQAGHCIDHADTIETVIEQYRSTVDPRNFIPEPALWNGFRNHHVKHNIRKYAESAYMQRIYYHRYLPFNLTSTIRTTYRRDTYIPDGVYFSSIHKDNIFSCLNVSWNYDFKSIVDNCLQKKCEGIPCDSQYVDAVKQFNFPDINDIPLPLYSSCDDTLEFVDQELVDYQTRLSSLQIEHEKIPEDVKDSRSTYVQDRLERVICEKTYRAAETEYSSIQYKFCFAMKLAQHGDIKAAIFYLDRVCEHMDILDQFESKKNNPLISKNNFYFFKKLKKKITLDEDNKYEEILSKVASKR